MEKKWPDVGKYKWQRMASLTVKEGAAMEELSTQSCCANVSQYCPWGN